MYEKRPFYGPSNINISGGAAGIRTQERVTPLQHFQCCSFGQLGHRSKPTISYHAKEDAVKPRANAS